MLTLSQIAHRQSSDITQLHGSQSQHYVRSEVFTAVTMKNGVFWDVNRVTLIRTDVKEELSASFIRVTRIG
jgi:hypothetical protein